MRHLPLTAQAWIGVVLAGGCVALGVATVQIGQLETAPTLPVFWLLLVGACIGHAFPAIAPRHQAYHATQSFLMAAVLLLSWPAVVLMVLAAHATEWWRRRRPWYIQLYNVAVYLMSTGAAMAVLVILGGRPVSLDEPRRLLAALVAAVGLLVVNHGLTAIVLRLARGLSVAESGLFGLESLGLDGTLLLVGVAMADAWLEQPLGLLVSAAPLLLIYRALRLTSVEEGSHRDRLTGLYNARHFLEALDLELRRASPGLHPTGLIVAVLDDVPRVIQRYGRATLDFLALGVAQRMRGSLRDFDLTARTDEATFGLLLPATQPDDLRTIAARIEEEVATQPFGLATTREPVAASISLAFACLDPGTRNADEVVAMVRQAAQRAALSGPRAVIQAAVVTPVGQAADLPPKLPHSLTPTNQQASENWSRPPLSMPAFEAAVIVPAVVLTVIAVLGGSWPDLSLAAGITGLVLLSELLAFELYDRSSFSVSFVPILAAGLLGGLTAALLATWTTALVRGTLRRSVWHRVLFNGSAFSLTGVLATVVATSGDRLPVRAGDLGPLAVTTAIASAVYYTHTLLIAGALALDLRTDPKRIWARNFQWLFPHYAVLGWMGLGLAVATIELGPPGAALFLAPPLAMRFVLRQYVERTTGAVQRLEATNAELRATSALLRQRGDELSLLSDLGQLAAAVSRTESLPARVVRHCVPALGDLCTVVWRGPRGLEHALHATAEAEAIATGLEARTSADLLDLAAQVAVIPSAESTSGQQVWLSAPLSGVERPLGWLMGVTCHALDDNERERRQTLMRDVAQRLALMLERDALLEEAAELDALRLVDRAKSDFIATTAHELRTPLTSLQGYAELLRNESEPSLRDRWLRILHVEAAQLGQVVDQLLDVSRLDSGRFRAERSALDLTQVVQRVVEEFSDQATLTGHRFAIDFADSTPLVYADVAHVHRVLRNLISNALRYSPAGGEVRVSAEMAPAEVEVCVMDEGLGIPAEWLGRLFERFQRVDLPERASIRGTGLGLYIARQLVELNGGRIWVTSDGVDRGSAFHFTLPPAPPRVHQTRRRSGKRKAHSS